MSVIKKEIEQCMSDLIESNQTLAARFIFPEDFIGFRGHFPIKKILPGICQIQCAVTMLEKWKELPVVVKEIILAKFFSIVIPLEEIICVCKGIEQTDEDFILRASIRKGDKKISEMKLKIRFDREACGK